MPNGHEHKEYGGHDYPNQDGTSDCKYGCGCWMGPARSGGPTGLDPFGDCPKNPADGKLLGGHGDYDYVVTERIESLESRVAHAENRLKKVSPKKSQLADELVQAKLELFKKDQVLTQLRHILGQGQ